jgi:hypothetical protein
MLSEEQIRQALHASCVVPLTVAKPHGPLGLEQLAAAVSRINPALGPGDARVRRPIALDQATWEKLDRLAETAAQTTSHHVTASQVAAAIIEQYVAALLQQSEAQE